MDYRKHLQELRNKLTNRHMSLMVGSGFSKNASLKFPTWDELLQDLVYDMHKTDINQRFLEAAKVSSRRKVDRGEFVKNSCRDIIKKRGYLDVVSDFLRNSHPESIATYIEARTPFIHVAEDKSMLLEIGGKQEEFTAERLSLHKSLIRLHWNNIYTTNYDQLLDLCVDEYEHSRVLKDIVRLEQEISRIDEQLRGIEKENEELDQQEAAEAEKSRSNKTNGSEPMPETESKDVAERRDRRTELRDERYALSSQKDNKKNQVTMNQAKLFDCFNIVREASALRLKRDKNIIKLHGSLRSKVQRENHFFEFDNDNKKQYVIAREDYDTYRDKHEAFTQLMRISLLQESFCLVGFSGDDPNFHAWIGWVRDILQREKRELNEEKSYKIYLIDINNENPTADRELFYENYHIIRIPLPSPEVVDYLKADLQIRDQSEPDRREILQMFIAYLDNQTGAKSVVSSPNAMAETEWKSVWSIARMPKKYWNEDHEIETLVSRLEAIKDKIEIPNFIYTYRQKTALKTLFYDNIRYPDKPFTPSLSKFIIYALKDYYVPVSQILDPSAIAKLREQTVVRDEIEYLITKDRTIALKEYPDDNNGFLKMVSLAFRFRFSELRQWLDNWQPSPGEVRKKAGFLSLLDPEAAEDYLVSEFKAESKFTPEQRLYLLEHQVFIGNSLRYPGNPRLTRQLRAYENAGFRPIYENLEYILKHIEETDDKPEPRGAGRYSVGRGNFNAFEHYSPHSLQYLQLLLESGFQFNIRRAYWLTEDKWYKIFKWGFELYPHAFLFYSLQFNDTNYLKRVGEDYAYSNKIDNEVREVITLNLFSAVSSAPQTYQKNIELFLSRLLNGVRPSVWEAPYMTLFRESIRRGTAFEEAHLNPLTDLNNFAFQFLEQENNILEILHAIFIGIGSEDRAGALNSLYYFSKNIHYKLLSEQSILSSGIPGAIDSIIGQLNAKASDCLLVIGNAHRLLSDQQKIDAANRITEFNFQDIHDPRSWEVISLFLGKDDKSVGRIKQAVLISKGLWDTGKTGPRSWTNSEPIHLSRITLDGDNSGIIIWSEDEVLEIYRLLEPAVTELQDIFKQKNNIFSYNDLIREIKWFLFRYAEILQADPGYAARQKVIDELHHKNTNYDDVEDGLLSDEHADVVWALSEVSEQYRKGEANFEHIHIVLNKCLLQKNPAVEAALSYVASWVQHNKQLLNFQGAAELLISILRKYRRHPLENGDSAYVEERLIRIAYGMRGVKNADKEVEWWINHGQNSRFNNIRQLVFRRNKKIAEAI